MAASTVDELWDDSVYSIEVVVRGKTRVFVLQEMDLPTMLWEGIITQPLLDAADRFSALHDLYEAKGGQKAGAASDAAVVGSMTAEDKANMRSLLERYAVAAVVAPPLTATGEAGKFPVQRLTIDVLSTIFASRDPNEVPRLEGDAAQAFRAAQPPVDGASRSDGAAVRPATQLVAAPEDTEDAQLGR